MIHTKDLRRNNLVEEEILGWVTVNEIYENSVSVLAKHMNVDRSVVDVAYTISAPNLRPIPLTPEILEACGFKFGGGARWYIPKEKEFGLEFQLVGNKIGLQIQDRFVEKEYLHQLQNLFYFLTGEELEYKQ